LRIAPKVPSKTKDQARTPNRVLRVSGPNARLSRPWRQIRHYYHRVLRKINQLLSPLTDCVDSYDTDDVRLALLSWCVPYAASSLPLATPRAHASHPQVEHAAQAQR
jgi:hypothetical protein